MSIGLFVLKKRIGIACFLVAVLLGGTARIVVGLHWVSDIVAGIAIGSLSCWFVFRAIKLPHWKVAKSLADLTQRHMLLQACLVLVVIECRFFFMILDLWIN